jgi:hypothetical protein
MRIVRNQCSFCDLSCYSTVVDLSDEYIYRPSFRRWVTERTSFPVTKASRQPSMSVQEHAKASGATAALFKSTSVYQCMVRNHC